MESLGSTAPQPFAYIPAIPIFDPLEFDRSLPSSQYTLIKTDDLRIMYKEISRVQAYLHNLIHHGSTAQSLVIDNSKQTKPAAVERVPPEILSMIFKQLVPPQNNNDLIPLKIPKLKDILLPGQVCRLWREAAIATASLWSSLYFNFKKREINVGRMVNRATTCITRAKGYPLSIHLVMYAANLTQYRPIIAVLLAHSHQWEDLLFDCSLGSLENVHEELQGATGRLSMLRRLKIRYYGDIEDWGSFDTFLTLPKLRIVDLYNDGQPWRETGEFPLLPWSQLQQITFEGQTTDALEILRTSPSLQVFRASIVEHSVGLHHVHHPFLRELTVASQTQQIGATAASDFFGHVTLPALVSLTYKSDTEVFPGIAVTSFVQRSEISQSIHTFALTLAERHIDPVFSMSSSNISDCLEHMPGLSQLSLRDYSKRYTDKGPFHSGDISSICASLIDDEVLPKLKRFSITGPPQMSYVYLALMVKSRWQHTVSDLVWIESVEVNYERPCAHAKSSMTRIPAYIGSRDSGRALALLRQYRSEGLRVVGSPVDEEECIECIEEQGYEAFDPDED